jgi:hypothetical protein
MAVSTKVSKPGVWLLLGALGVVGAQSAACSSKFSSCHEHRNCPKTPQPEAGAGGDESGGSSGGAGRPIVDASVSGRAGADGTPAEAGAGGTDEVAGMSSGGTGNGNGGVAGDVYADGGSADGGEPGAPRCGDGNIGQDEKCDDGANNGAGKACNAQCQPNVCGDGDKGPREGCDNGTENGFELLRCAPDCSRIIEIKHFILAPKELPNSNLQPNPVATADATCPVGYKALFAHGTTRRATTTPFKAQNSIDWVIRPYTYYYNDRESPLWLTDSVPLLGVRNGKFTALENRTSAFIALTVTGLNPDYTTLGINNCQGWSSIQNGEVRPYGLPPNTDAGFMYSLDDARPCGTDLVYFYCVEQ